MTTPPRITAEFIENVHAICIDAGNTIMAYFPDNIDAGVIKKSDGSPVTHADAASERIILDGLTRLTPDIPAISEEQFGWEKPSPNVKNAQSHWLVDPLDGTKEFIKGSHDFCINIALIQDKKPIFGAVFCPATHHFYYGGPAIGGAFLNSHPIKTRPFDIKNSFTIVGTQNYKTNKKLVEYLGLSTVTNYITKGSTLKFLLIAEGQADFYARFVPTYEWDTAAAHAMLLALGGDIIDFETKQRLTYGKKGFLNGHLITGTNNALKHFNLPACD